MENITYEAFGMPMWHASMRHILQYLVAGTRGGHTRARILSALSGQPMNAHRLCKALSLDYKTIEHHLNILIKNSVLKRVGAYGGVYIFSDEIEADPSLRDIWAEFG
jgi:DNA-binding transcriptional ArsR family regulator